MPSFLGPTLALRARPPVHAPHPQLAVPMSNMIDDEDYAGSYEHGQDLNAAYAEGGESLASQEYGGMHDNDATASDVTFAPLGAAEMDKGVVHNLRVPVPLHRLTPLRDAWMDIYTPIAQHMKLQIRFDTAKRFIELQTCEETESPHAITKAADFCRAFVLGFELRDAIALLRLDDLYIDTFHIKEVRQVSTDEEVSRSIGRIAGHNGKTKFTIENATKTRIVLNEGQINILGYVNIPSYSLLL